MKINRHPDLHRLKVPVTSPQQQQKKNCNISYKYSQNKLLEQKNSFSGRDLSRTRGRFSIVSVFTRLTKERRAFGNNKCKSTEKKSGTSSSSPPPFFFFW
ncbi:hypothetical protein CEXT_216931 [Caerostris extrusa]|uniref:Uncharacterized protein n=1 Tax=Caerostris extrusa TaxID=172846 RepID=A0AAV4NI57_CAEEX|nr:hypothetical protein CEXT_216931 [Caerostris extrusa]